MSFHFISLNCSYQSGRAPWAVSLNGLLSPSFSGSGLADDWIPGDPNINKDNKLYVEHLMQHCATFQLRLLLTYVLWPSSQSPSQVLVEDKGNTLGISPSIGLLKKTETHIWPRQWIHCQTSQLNQTSYNKKTNVFPWQRRNWCTHRPITLTHYNDEQFSIKTFQLRHCWSAPVFIWLMITTFTFTSVNLVYNLNWRTLQYSNYAYQ